MKKSNILWIVGTVLAVLLFVGAFFLYDSLGDSFLNGDTTAENSSADNSGDTSQEVRKVPDFTVFDAEGNEVKLSDYFGKPIVLNFWASWCPPCKAEMPHFEEAFKANTDIQFLMVNVTTSDRESLEKAKVHIESEGYTFPVVYDTTGIASNTYQTYSLPVTYFIAKDGSLATYHIGMIDKTKLESCIELISK